MKSRDICLCALIVLCLGGLVAGLFGQSASPTEYKVSHGYKHVRPGGVSSNDTALTVSTSSWHDVSEWQQIPEDWDSVSLSFYGYGDGSGPGSPNGGTANAYIYVVHEYGSAIHVANVTLHFGQLQMSHDPAYGWGSHYRTSQVADPNHTWADGPISSSQQSWRSPVQVSGTTNGIGEVSFNHQGATRIRVLFDGKADVTTVFAVMTGRRR